MRRVDLERSRAIQNFVIWVSIIDNGATPDVAVTVPRCGDDLNLRSLCINLLKIIETFPVNGHLGKTL